MTQPSDLDRAIALRRAAGGNYKAIRAEFGVGLSDARKIVEKVRRFDLGAAILRANPTSFMGMELTGVLPRQVRRSLAHVGLHRVEDLNGMGSEDLLTISCIGQKWARLLLDLRASCKPMWPTGQREPEPSQSFS